MTIIPKKCFNSPTSTSHICSFSDILLVSNPMGAKIKKKKKVSKQQNFLKIIECFFGAFCNKNICLTHASSENQKLPQSQSESRISDICSQNNY